MSNGIDFSAMTRGVPNVTPPSKELLKVMVFAAMFVLSQAQGGRATSKLPTGPEAEAQMKRIEASRSSASPDFLKG